MNILTVKKVVKKFGGVTAVSNCTFSVRENSITSLIGPNGAGKTTMFDLITGSLAADSGEIYFRDVRIDAFPIFTRSALGIGRTFQAIRVFPELTALENIVLACPGYPTGLIDAFRSRRPEEKATRQKAYEYLTLIGLEEKAHVKAGDLSYGQQKLIEIVRAAATNAQLLLLDEPAAGVNRVMLARIVSLIQKLHSEGKTIVIIEHDMGFVMELSEHVIVMDYGKEIADGTPKEVQRNSKVLEAYLGV